MEKKNPERGYELIKKLFSITDETISGHNDSTTQYIKKYLSDDNIDSWQKVTFSYINKLDNNNIKIYAQFGADKAGVRDINRFLSKFNLDKNEIQKTIGDDLEKSKSLPEFSREKQILLRPTFSTPDKKLVITVSNPNFLKDGYFHYLGVTGEAESVYEFIYYFQKLGFDDGLCFGGRDYI